VILPVSGIDRAARFYAKLLADDGRRVSEQRHYFDCGNVVLALVDPVGDGMPFRGPNPDHVYFAVDDLEVVLQRCREAGGAAFDVPDQEPGIAWRSWGERSFYVQDPFGNPLCFVERGTEFTGLPRPE
jgi:predicted enzyme related to lactoylglutathione lyase